MSHKGAIANGFIGEREFPWQHQILESEADFKTFGMAVHGSCIFLSRASVFFPYAK